MPTDVGAPVVVVGGGIAGLSTAWQLKRDGMPVRLLEAHDRVGGKIQSTPFAGRIVDEAADAFLARVPHGIEMATELGLADQLIAPTARRAQVWTTSGLQALPDPNVLGIPLERAAAEAFLGNDAADRIDADLARTEPDPVQPGETIGSVVRRRLGDEIHQALVDPLIGAINAGDTDQLDLIASSPQISAAAQAGPSLIAALKRMRAAADPAAPVFHSFRGGMQVFVDALAESVADITTTGVGVQRVRAGDDGVLEVQTGDESISASAVVLACPPSVAAELTNAWVGASAHLRAIPLVSVTLVTLAYPAGSLEVPSEFSGFVVPRGSELTITACSYATNKWPHLGDDIELLRVSVGHTGDQVTPALEDAALVEVVRNDLNTAIGLSVAPTDVRISRWPAAFPQYTAGHLDRLALIEGELNPAGVFLAGMGYRGIGVPANIDQGRSAGVEAILHVLD